MLFLPFLLPPPSPFPPPPSSSSSLSFSLSISLQFIEVDDIAFFEPVEVGELLLFHSRILYTCPDGGVMRLDGDKPLIMVEVTATVTCPEKVSSKLSNKFNFTFSLPDGESCKQIVPSDDEEAIAMSKRIIADLQQSSEDKGEV